MMDFDAFWAAVVDAQRQMAIDTPAFGLQGPGVSLDSPTPAALEAATDTLIQLEQQLAGIPDRLVAIDDLASRINYHYDPEYAALPDAEATAYFDGFVPRRDAPSSVRSGYEGGVAHLTTVRASLIAEQQVLQALVSTWTAARAKIEHDLHWQAYLRDNHGIDPASIERELKARVVDGDNDAVEALAA